MSTTRSTLAWLPPEVMVLSVRVLIRMSVCARVDQKEEYGAMEDAVLTTIRLTPRAWMALWQSSMTWHTVIHSPSTEVPKPPSCAFGMSVSIWCTDWRCGTHLVLETRCLDDCEGGVHCQLGIASSRADGTPRMAAATCSATEPSTPIGMMQRSATQYMVVGGVGERTLGQRHLASGGQASSREGSEKYARAAFLTALDLDITLQRPLLCHVEQQVGPR